MLKYCRTVIIFIGLILLTSCGKETQTVSENDTSETQETFGEAMDEVQMPEYTVHGFGQYFGATITGDVVQIYPHYGYDKYVKIEPVTLSRNNFWYDFVTSKGYTMSDVIRLNNGTMLLDTPEYVFGYVPISSDLCLLTSSSTLPADYTRMVLNHIE